MTISMTDQSSSSTSTRHAGPSTWTPIPTVEKRVSDSTEIWARDLRSLFEHAKERFGDVTWESEEGGARIWAHKAVIYARAPKTFKERYFPPRSFSRSPHSFASPSPSPTPYLPAHLLHGNGRSHGTYSAGSASLHAPRSGTESSLSVASINSEHTIRGQGGDAVLRLTHGDTPELFSAQLEWLYTGEGFGDVVEWIEEDNDTGGSIRDSLGRRGDIHDRRDKLGQDLTYMWRSKLYVDVRIHLTPQDTLDGSSDRDERDDDSDSSTDSLSSTAVFTSHRFILCSRSPYFASVLLNPSFKPKSTADIHLPTPPFTPAALHFCLGYMYAGHLDFSNRSFDLSTAFAIYRAAMYLQLEALVQEIESRIVHDFCHGLDTAKCRCRRCPLRAARVWRFACEPDIGAVQLRDQARRYVVHAWGQAWGREIGLASVEEKDQLVRDICNTIGPGNIIGTWRNLVAVRTRMENGSRSRGREAAAWVDPLTEMVDAVESHAREVLLGQFPKFAESSELWTLVSGKGFDGEILEIVAKEIVDSVGTAKGCIEGPKVYQALVSSILLKVDPNTLGPALPPRSRSRQEIEQAREGVLAHIRRRWMQIRDAAGFHHLDNWALKEISDEIEISVDELLGPSAISPVVRTRLGGPGIPRTTSRVMSLSDAASVRSTATFSSQASSSRPSTVRAEAQSEAPGLRRLRLSSSASTVSVTSARSARSVSGPSTAPLPGGASARSPTAARVGTRVAMGAARARDGASPTPSTRQGKEMRGPPRPLLTRPSQPASSAASVTSVRTTRTTASAAPSASPRATTSPRSPTKIAAGDKGKSVASATTARQPSATAASARLQNATAGPSRPAPSIAPVRKPVARSSSPAPSTTSVRKPVARPKSPAPSTASVRSRMASNASLAPKTTTTIPSNRVRQPSAASQSTVVKPSTLAKPAPVPSAAGRPAVGSTVRSRAAAINAQNNAKQAESKPGPKPAVPTITRPPPKTATTIPERSPSVSSVASVASRKSTSKPASRLTIPTEPVPRIRAVSTTSATPASRSTPPIGRKGSSSTLRNVSDTPRSTTAVKSPLAPVARKSEPASRAFPSSERKRTGPERTHLAAPLGTVPLGSQSARSPSGSTDEASEAITPQMDSIVLEPAIRREGSDVSETPPAGSEKEAQTRVQPPPTARKTSQSSTRSTASSLRFHPASAFDPPRREVKPAVLPVLPIQEGLEAWTGPGMELRQGIGCIVSLDSKRARFRAMIKYIGLLKDAPGPWVGIETDELDRFGVKTLPTGAKDEIHYFHLSPPAFVPDINRTARQRKLDLIRQSLGKRASVFIGNTGIYPGKGTNTGLGVPRSAERGGSKRSISPFAGEHPAGGFERPRALFVRPHEVVFVLGAE